MAIEIDIGELLDGLRWVKGRGWVDVPERFCNSDGAFGNTLEELLGVEENNRRGADLNSWELKSQRVDTSSLVTLAHREPMPRSSIPKMIRLFGWPHAEAGKAYALSERSLRLDLSATHPNGRGFQLDVDRQNERLFFDFFPDHVSPIYREWENGVLSNPLFSGWESPYWDFSVVDDAIREKLYNTIHMQVERREINGLMQVRYGSFRILGAATLERFLDAFERDAMVAEIDARTGHNHGTKLRVKQKEINSLYSVSFRV